MSTGLRLLASFLIMPFFQNAESVADGQQEAHNLGVCQLLFVVGLPDGARLGNHLGSDPAGKG